MKNFNELTPAEAERLALLAEECGEAVQAIGKILRHGYQSYHPDSVHITNRQLLEKELGDIYAAVNLMQKAEDIDRVAIAERCVTKLDTVGQYLHHQPERTNP